MIDCIESMRGKHVVQKCIEQLPESVSFVVEAVEDKADLMATHVYGCRREASPSCPQIHTATVSFATSLNMAILSIRGAL